jgi:hypothetical protein
VRAVGLLIAVWFATGSPCLAETHPGGIYFTEQSVGAGIVAANVFGSERKRHILEAHGSGGAFFDYDGDGELDLYVANGSTVETLGTGAGNQLYHNLGGGRFEDVAPGAGVDDRGWSAGVAVGDIDSDGHADLYVTNYGGNLLYRNDGDGAFADATEQSTTAGSDFSASAAFFDADLDGDLDLYVTNYVEFSLADVPEDPAYDESCMYLGGIRVYCGPLGMPGAGDRLYRNDGGGGFTDVTSSSGVGAANDSYGLGVLPEDFDGDGRTDLFVANDETANVLFRNDGEFHFTNVATEAGVAFNGDGEAEAGMGVDAADYDNDGDADLYVTNFYGETNTLYRNDGAWNFADATVDAGLAVPTIPLLGWGTHFLDADFDGDLDLFVANGHVYPLVDATETGARYAQPNQLFRNEGAGAFSDISAESGSGLSVTKVSRGSCIGDYDGDGDVDIFVVNLNDTPTLLRNDSSNSGGWIALQLLGTGTQTVSGSRIQVRTETGVQTQTFSTAGGYLGANEAVLRFGVGEARSADVLVLWGDGTTTSMGAVATNRLLQVHRPEVQSTDTQSTEIQSN